MFPLAGAVRGGTVINVKSRSPDFGSLNKFKMSFKESQLQDMLCRFSDRDSRSEVVPAHISDDGNYITCQAAPAWSVPNVVTVSVAVNGVDFFSAVAVREAEFFMTWQPDVKQVCVQCLHELKQSYSRARLNRTALLNRAVHIEKVTYSLLPLFAALPEGKPAARRPVHHNHWPLLL
jgi:hypothetical protein